MRKYKMLVRETISFQRGGDPKIILGIGNNKETILNRINLSRGNVNKEIIEKDIEELSIELKGGFDLYLEFEDKETLYWLYKILGRKNIRIKSFYLEDYIKERDRNDDDAYDRIERIRDKWIKNGWDLFHEEDYVSSNVDVEYIFVKYPK
jgi:hypothetical protein